MVKKKRGSKKSIRLAEQPINPAQNTRQNPKLPVSASGQYPFSNSIFPAAAGAIGVVPDQKEGFDAAPKTQLEAVGNSGTQIFGGYYSEDYLSSIRGRQGAKKWDEMRRSDGAIAMILNAIMNPIKAANWGFEPYEQDDEFKKHADFIESVLKEQIDFEQFIHEALTVIPFGFVVFEVVHNVVQNHPDFGTFNGIESLGFRAQKTIENWILEEKTGKIKGINQYTYSDLGGNQFIPGEFLLVISHSKEGDNYEGISALRPILGSFMRKDLYLKLAAIGVEKYAVGTPVGTVPKGKEKSTEFNEFKNVLAAYTSHQSAFITVPEGWKIDIQKGDFDAAKIKELLTFENTEMATAFVANFLVLGMHGGGGAYALGSNLGEFFTTGIQSYANLVCQAVNKKLLPDLIKLNFGPQKGYPRLTCTGISDKAGKEFAETMKFLADGRLIDPDMPLKEFIRKQYKLPDPDPSTAVPLPEIPAGGAANFPKPGTDVVNPQTDKLQATPKLAEHVEAIRLADAKYVKQFDKNKAALKALMQSGLHEGYAKLKDLLRKKYNAAKGSDKILAAKNVEMPGLVAYKAALREALAEIAALSIQDARKRVPSKKKIKLAERIATVQLGESAYDALPPAIRKLIDAQASLVANTQASDIEKITFFQFTSSATTTDDIDSILHDVDGKVLDTIDGATGQGMSIDAAAGDATAHVTQEASKAFYFDPEVLDEIESFTFTNEDPVSEICQELAGTTFAVTDPDLDRYSPPLHHNCKSRLVPNLKGNSDNPDVDRGGVSVSQKALDSMTLHDPSTAYRLHGGKNE